MAKTRRFGFPLSPFEGEALSVLTLDALGDLTFACLAEGSENPSSPLRKPVLSTLSAEGWPSSRVVILRRFQPDLRQLSVFTDARSPKVTEIRQEPRASMVFYDPVADIQLRLKGHARICTHEAEADEAWATAPLPSRRAYLAKAAPGSVSPSGSSGLPDDVEGIIPPASRLEEGRSSFALLLFTFDAADILVLSRSGHRRARIRWSADGAGQEWLMP